MTKPQPTAQFLARLQQQRAAMREAVDAVALPAIDDPLAHAVAIEAFTTTLCALLAVIPDPSQKAALRARAKERIDAIDTIAAKVMLGAGKYGNA